MCDSGVRDTDLSNTLMFDLHALGCDKFSIREKKGKQVFCFTDLVSRAIRVTLPEAQEHATQLPEDPKSRVMKLFELFGFEVSHPNNGEIVITKDGQRHEFTIMEVGDPTTKPDANLLIRLVSKCLIENNRKSTSIQGMPWVREERDAQQVCITYHATDEPILGRYYQACFTRDNSTVEGVFEDNEIARALRNIASQCGYRLVGITDVTSP